MGNTQGNGESRANEDVQERGEEVLPYEEEEEERKLSYWEMAKYGYGELVNAIIRPPRAEYDISQLGPEYFEWHGRCFLRKDIELVNNRGQVIQCSHWSSVVAENTTSGPRPCLIYMHGNASARVEAISQLSLCLSLGMTLFAFDFSGSGHSDGDYVSLGYWEREDLATVIAHLRAIGTVSTIALWGRSMGAVTALLHSSHDPSIACIISDSAFADLTQLAEELVQKAKQNGLTVPGFVVSIAIRMIRSSVLKAAHFKIEDVAPIKDVDCAFVPALFVAGAADDFVMPHHSKQIHDKYAGDKNLVIIDGDHNSPRPRFLFDSAAIFLQNYANISQALFLPGADAFNLGFPPWIHTGSYGLNLADLGLNANDLHLQEQQQQQHLLGTTADSQQRVQDTLHNVFTGDRSSTSSLDQHHPSYPPPIAHNTNQSQDPPPVRPPPPPAPQRRQDQSVSDPIRVRASQQQSSERLL